MDTHGPIQKQYRDMMNQLGAQLDELLNGKPPAPKRVGFALLVFEFNSVGERMNYISNAQRADMLCALKEFIAHAEGRVGNICHA